MSDSLDPTLVKLIVTVVGVLVIGFLFQFMQRYVSRRVRDPEMRYRARRFVGSLGYVAYALVIVTVFGNELSGLTVALGVAGAGVAFALQEIIASIAGWAAVSFGHFYQTGDRVQLGHHGGCDRHRHPAHHDYGMRRVGERRSVQRPRRAGGQ